MLVIEDLHWADRSTGDLLGLLVRNQRQAPVLVVVTFRSEEMDRVPLLRRLIAELGRMDGVMHLELPAAVPTSRSPGNERHPGPATRADGRHHRVPAGRRESVFAEALLDAGGMASAGLRWSLRELLLSRVKELPGRAQRREAIERIVVDGRAYQRLRRGQAAIRWVLGRRDATMGAPRLKEASCPVSKATTTAVGSACRERVRPAPESWAMVPPTPASSRPA